MSHRVDNVWSACWRVHSRWPNQWLNPFSILFPKDEAGARGNKLCMPSDEQGYTVGNCPTDSVYPYITLGYSYGFLAWAAIFPIMYEPAYSLYRTAVVTQPSTNTCDKSSPPSAPFLRSNHSVSQSLTCAAAVHIPTTTTLHLAPAKAHLDEDDAASARC